MMKRQQVATELLDDADVGGALTRIRALGALIGVAARDADPAVVATVAWLVEGLAADALDRLKAVANRPATGHARTRRCCTARRPPIP